MANAVVHAAALGLDDGLADNRQLLAYVVPKPGSEPDLAGLRQALAQALPSHMLPVDYLLLDDLPLSDNGKLDRQALPLPSASAEAAPGRGRPPARGLESRLAAVFQQLLGLDQVGAEEDFFALGGHSLLAMRLAAAIRRELGRPVSVGQIMTCPTVAALAALLNSDVMLNDFGNDGFAPLLTLRPAAPEGGLPPLFCVYPGSGFAWQYSVLSRHLQPGQAIIGLQSPRPDGLIARSASMDELVAGQLAVIREQQPRGPYFLLGYSLGGTVAYGVASRLREQGETVAFLGLLDTYPAEVHDWTDPEGAEAALGAEREQTQVLEDAYGGGQEEGEDGAMRREREAMLSQIFANYRDAVALLARTETPRYDGEVTLFIARQSLPDYIRPRRDWQPYAHRVRAYSLEHCSHETILSPASLETLGPMLNRLLTEAVAAAGGAAGLEPDAPVTPLQRDA